QSAANAFCSSAIGIFVGALFFPTPEFAPLVNIPGGGDLLNSFAAALVTSTLITFLWWYVDTTFRHEKVTAFNLAPCSELSPIAKGLTRNSSGPSPQPSPLGREC
ncbi:MAG: hypothetical protein AAFR18_23415, partial [Cyanobacteria bacterium J06627_32]